jgi:hypothetical protein
MEELNNSQQPITSAITGFLSHEEIPFKCKKDIIDMEIVYQDIMYQVRVRMMGPQDYIISFLDLLIVPEKAQRMFRAVNHINTRVPGKFVIDSNRCLNYFLENICIEPTEDNIHQVFDIAFDSVTKGLIPLINLRYMPGLSVARTLALIDHGRKLSRADRQINRILTDKGFVTD